MPQEREPENNPITPQEWLEEARNAQKFLNPVRDIWRSYFGREPENRKPQ